MTMDRETLKRRLKELLVSGLRLQDTEPASIADDQPIFVEGLGLDSIDALEFVVLVEERFGVSIPDETAAKQAFASIDALTDFIHGSRQAQAG